jgi:hypothetical protein
MKKRFEKVADCSVIFMRLVSRNGASNCLGCGTDDRHRFYDVPLGDI